MDTDEPSLRQPSNTSYRILALLEVIICSDYPTQLAVGATFAALGRGPYRAGGALSIGYVAGVSVADTVLLVALILLFLYSHRESPRAVFLGNRPVVREIAIGVPLTLFAMAIGVAVLVTIQKLAPSLHTVEKNPLQALLRSPRDTWLFVLVVIVAGGVREELQRAFLLHRFEDWLGGGAVGVVVTSAAFGAGHLLQGADAAIATGLLGAFWGIVYLWRRSVVGPMVSHAGFDLLQIVGFLAAR
ncbi:MAG TPA: CPBP family intramembrane glutamic endopeptidase [Rhodanobacteraceae bacterium]